jgi:DNA mismatch repair ATPase MutS
MKAFLMYQDRDLDPMQVLSRRDRNSRASAKDQSLSLQQILPSNAAALTQDLGLDILFNAMALGDNFLFEVATVALLSSVTDPQTIRYREHILKDCMRNEAIVREMYQIACEAISEERRRYWSLNYRHPSSTLHQAIDVLQMLIGKLRRLRRIADRHAGDFPSYGVARLFAMLATELSDEYFATIEQHLKRLQFRRGVLVSAQLGKGNKAANYLLRKPHHDQRNWILRLLQRPAGYTFHLHPRDEAGAQALANLQNQGIDDVANATAQSADHIVSFFQMLRTELGFYIGCLNLKQKLEGLGVRICLPAAAPFDQRELSFSGLYDVCLALSTERKVVGNDLNGDGKDLIVITGANSGGKSTFLRGLGIGQLMMQAGMFVAAESFSAEVREGIFTHFRREEDAAMESGKLDEELSRMSGIVDATSPRSMVLFNESFSATNEWEGSEIATQITSALLESGVKVSFVTHLNEFARRLHDRKMPNAIFLRAERLPDGTRTYRLIEADPLQTSYGNDVYEAEFGSEGVRPIQKQPLSAAE